MILLKLFFSFFKIGLFAIGGAYSFLPLIEREAVQKYHWLTKEEFLDVLGIAKIFPGAISIKYATYIGNKIDGLSGAIVANLGNLLGPAILIIIVSAIYTKYKNLPQLAQAFGMMQLAVFSMILAVAFELVNIQQIMQLRNLFVIILSFLLFAYAKVNPALILIACGILGVVLK